ncbi:MAG: gliding motility protein GldN [Crocinitomicaceae bacterium]|nr:gliding motility protein GldN [Crocinitomicaceae bacterium]
MKAVRHLATLICVLAVALSAEAQTQTVLDGAYVKETNLTKRVIPYPSLREADVMYVRRIWQDIDLRQKINQMFYFPVDPIEDRKNLFDVIRYALEVEGSLTAYGTGPAGDDDEFRYPYTGAQVDSVLNPVVIIPQFDPVTGEVIGSMEAETTLNSQDIVRYRVKEDWVWDRQRSQRQVRIIGIAPIIEKKDDEGNSQGLAPLFWLYYPECRYVFANAECYNYENDAQRRTFEEIFQKRFFSSYIVKETNVFDRSIADYAQGLDALLESERIKDELFTIEHDLWHY